MLTTAADAARKDVLGLFASESAAEVLGVGAGGDLTQRIDVTAERAIICSLKEQGAQFTVVSEELGIESVGVRPQFSVVMDPIDGTTNAIRGIPFFATSIGVSSTSRLSGMEAGLVVDLLNGTTFVAERGRGSFLDKTPLKPSTTTDVGRALVGVDLNAPRSEDCLQRSLQLFRKVDKIRHLGANALELCYVASGAYDAFVDIRNRLRITDIAAAQLIICEAGGVMLTPEGRELDAPLVPTQRVSFVAAGNRELCNQISKLVGASL